MSPLFSQRKGIRPLEKSIQIESIDKETRNRIWSILVNEVWKLTLQRDGLGNRSEVAKYIFIIGEVIWQDYYKHPIDDYPGFNIDRNNTSYSHFRSSILNDEWWKVFDFLEFLIKLLFEELQHNIVKLINHIFEMENCAYRIIDLKIVDITDKIEIESIELSLELKDESSTHLSQALAMLSDRKTPDFRNSIKESISAVESCCRKLTKQPKATLSECLKKIKGKGILHPAFEDALNKLYGYTSDESGIRHSLTEKDYTPSYADAKYMLVICSAYVNFIWTKVAELGIEV